MSRLSTNPCGTRARSNSISPSPSRSPSITSYISASASPRSGPSPTPSSKVIKSKDMSPRKRPFKKLVRSLTLPSAENSLLPVKVLFPDSSEFEDPPSPLPSKMSNLSSKFKSQIFSDFQTVTKASSVGSSQRAKSYPPSAANKRSASSATTRLEFLRALPGKKTGDSTGLKGARPKTLPIQSIKEVNVNKNKGPECGSPTNVKAKKSSNNALSQTVTNVLPKKKSKKKQAKIVEANVKSEQLILKVGTFSRVLNAMKK